MLRTLSHLFKAVSVLTMFLSPLQPLYAQQTSCSYQFWDGMGPIFETLSATKRTTMTCSSNATVLVSGITKGPLWAAEYLNGRSVSESPRIGAISFKNLGINTSIPANEAPKISDYANHDFVLVASPNDTTTTAGLLAALSVSNALPASPKLTQITWPAIEQQVRSLASKTSGLYTVTGPLFEASMELPVGSGIVDPTSIWKAVYDPLSRKSGVFVCNNDNTAACQVMSVAAFEERSGISPFPAMSTSQKQQIGAFSLPNNVGQIESSALAAAGITAFVNIATSHTAVSNSNTNPAWQGGPGNGPWTQNFSYACSALGIDPISGSTALHDAKSSAGLSGGDNCWFHTTLGTISFGGEDIGNLFD